MAGTRPHCGPVEVGAPTLEPVTHKHAGGSIKNGLWRPDDKFHGKFGLRLTMRREHGVTRGEVLQVPFRFQVPVMGNFDRQYQFNWATFDTIRVGEKSRPDGRQLLVLQINTMFLDSDAAHAATRTVVWHGRRDPQRMIEELKWIMGYTPGSTAQVFRLVISQPAIWGHKPLVNMLATLTVCEPVQQAGEVGAEYLNATFEEFPEDEDIARKQRPQHHGATKVKLKPGDTLYEIAKKSHFHQASSWKTIAKANGITGVSPSSADELAGWAKKHHKTDLRIPAKGRA